MDDTMSDAPDAMVEQDQEALEHKLINEEYKIWKKNSVFLYDMLYGRALEWPTLTTQWLPDKKSIEGTDMSTHRVILGTHTSNQAQNYVQIAHVEIPDPDAPDLAELNEERGEVGGYGNAKKPMEFKVVQKINHPGEVNKARYQPQNPDIIASLCVDGRVLVFDRTKHPLQPKNDGTIKSEAELVGHEKEGFALSWSPLTEGHLATGNEDTTVRTWDLKSGFSKGNSSISSTATYTVHSATVNDVQYHPIFPFLIGTASDDLTWQIIDTRVSTHKSALYKKLAHVDAVNCIAFHPEMEPIFASGSADKTVAIWDMRNFDKKLHTFQHHREDVIGLQWHPTDNGVLASSSYDRRICFWDLDKLGNEQTPEEAEDGPPELLFMHGGFTNRICDFDWNKNDPWVVLGAAEDNQLQIFRPARKLVEEVEKNTNHGEVENAPSVPPSTKPAPPSSSVSRVPPSSSATPSSSTNIGRTQIPNQPLNTAQQRHPPVPSSTPARASSPLPLSSTTAFPSQPGVSAQDSAVFPCDAIQSTENRRNPFASNNPSTSSPAIARNSFGSNNPPTSSSAVAPVPTPGSSSSSAITKSGRKSNIVPEVPWHEGTGDNLRRPYSPTEGRTTAETPAKRERKPPKRFEP